MTLRDKLDAQRARSAVNPVWRATYEATIAELRRSNCIEQALLTGARFPDFLLPDAAGRLITLSDLLAGGPLVVTFIRGQWCPYCALTLAALEQSLPDITAAGGRLVAITPETGGRALAVTRQHDLHYDVLVDVDSGIGLLCGVVFRVPEPYRSSIARAGVDLADRQGNGAWLLPVPAVYVVGRDGVIRWDFMDIDYTRRAEPPVIVQALRTLT